VRRSQKSAGAFDPHITHFRTKKNISATLWSTWRRVPILFGPPILSPWLTRRSVSSIGLPVTTGS
jgi:hypothetical protein